MEFVNMFYNSLLWISSFILVFSLLVHGYRLFFYKEVFKEFKEGVSLYFSGLIKALKNYKLQLLSSLFIFCDPMRLYTILGHIFSETSQAFFLFKVLFYVIYSCYLSFIFSYMLLGCYDLLKNGKVLYRSILLRTRETGKKIVFFSFLNGIVIYFICEYIFIFSSHNALTPEFLLARFTVLQLSMILFLILNPFVLFFSYFSLFLLIDQESYRKAASSSLHFVYKSIPLSLGLTVSHFFLASLFELMLLYVILLLQKAFPQLFSGFLIVKPLFSFYIRQLLALGEYIAIVSYWLYSRKEQDLPFGPEYIESRKG